MIQECFLKDGECKIRLMLLRSDFHKCSGTGNYPYLADLIYSFKTAADDTIPDADKTDAANAARRKTTNADSGGTILPSEEMSVIGIRAISNSK
jgi:hypothetical protein